MAHEHFANEQDAEERCEELRAVGRCAYVLMNNSADWEVRHWY